MNKSTNKFNFSRRQFLKQGGSLAAGAAVLGSLAPSAFAATKSAIARAEEAREKALLAKLSNLADEWDRKQGRDD